MAIAEPTRAPAAPQSDHALRPIWNMAENMWEPIRSIERCAAALTLISLTPDVDGTAAGKSIFQLARTIDENLHLVDESQREIVGATNSWNQVVANVDDGNGEVEPAAGDVARKPDRAKFELALKVCDDLVDLKRLSRAAELAALGLGDLSGVEGDCGAIMAIQQEIQDRLDAMVTFLSEEPVRNVGGADHGR